MLSLFTLLKFLHVTGAILWLGGLATLSVFYMRLSQLQEPAALRSLPPMIASVGGWFVGPAAVITLLAGIGTAATVGYDFGSLWITWGFGAILASIVLGATLIRRTTNAIAVVVAAPTPNPGQLLALQRRLTGFNLLNLLILVSTVWVMVAKPM